MIYLLDQIARAQLDFIATEHLEDGQPIVFKLTDTGGTEYEVALAEFGVG